MKGVIIFYLAMLLKNKKMKKYIILFTFLLIGINLFSQTINAPIDYQDLDKGYFKLDYEFGNVFNPELPTVIVIADAQQFYVRKGRITKIQDELFGKRFNVLGIIPRSFNEDLTEKISLKDGNKTNWKLAYTLFNSFQFANDIELIRKEVLKDHKNVHLYGQSGGAFLITEYLSLFPETNIKKVFIGASVNPVIENKLGINHDNFQRDYLAKNKNDKVKLDRVLEENFFSRKLVASLFQRQNFFVELSELNNTRSELIDHLYLKDTTYINNLKKEYQIDAINGLFDSEVGIPIRVRLSEFIYPMLENWKNNRNSFYPDLENSYNIAYPLLALNKKNNFDISQGFNEKSFRKFKGEVFILSARYDHVADYRSSIYLNGLLENGTLFIVDDDHTFKSLKSHNDYAKLIQCFFDSTSKDWQSYFSSYLWKEK